MKAIVKGAVISGAGALLLGTSLALSSATVVSGASPARPDATMGKTSIKCNSKGGRAYCLTVQDTRSGNAIEGVAAKAIGVSGSGFTGVYGSGTRSNTAGVYGTSTSRTGTGTYGISNGGYGVWGTSSNSDGVYGISGSGVGVSGNSSSSAGVYGYSGGALGGFFESDSSVEALGAQSDAADGFPLLVSNSNTGDEVYVDPDGDGVFDGSVTARAFKMDLRVRGGPRLEAFSPESTRATIEDTGTARLEEGEAAVRFDSAFAGTIDAARGYQVFLTPNGETRGWLYVAAKYEGGFIVREAERGRSSIYFDYRVVAHPYGASDARLPQLNLKPPPTPHLPQHVQPQQPPQP
jgi:hypothetical protein